MHYNLGHRPVRGPVGFWGRPFAAFMRTPQVTIMPRFILLGLIIGLLLTPLKSVSEGAEPFEVPPAEREVAAHSETQSKQAGPREIRPEELEGFDQIRIGSGPRTHLIRKAEMERNFRERLAEVRKEAVKLRQEESELLKQAEQAGLSIKVENSETPKQEKPLLQFKAETEKIKHLRAAAEHLEAAEMHGFADSLTRQADAIAQFIKETQASFEAALDAEAEKAKDPAYHVFGMGKLKSSGKIDPSVLQERLQELIRLQQEAK